MFSLCIFAHQIDYWMETSQIRLTLGINRQPFALPVVLRFFYSVVLSIPYVQSSLGQKGFFCGWSKTREFSPSWYSKLSIFLLILTCTLTVVFLHTYSLQSPTSNHSPTSKCFQANTQSSAPHILTFERLRLVKWFISHRLHTGACVNLALLTYLLWFRILSLVALKHWCVHFFLHYYY